MQSVWCRSMERVPNLPHRNLPVGLYNHQSGADLGPETPSAHAMLVAFPPEARSSKPDTKVFSP